jgi:acyl-CoA reductase-like NAD-dependent aldehyde dehydrogenase
MRSYPALIGGRDSDHTEWVHTVRASAMLRDEMSALKLKRRLDRGMDHTTNDSRVLGRVGICDRKQIVAACAAARDAQPAWAAMGLEARLECVRTVRKKVHANAESFIDTLIAEGHPRKLAEWEVAGTLRMTSDESLDIYRRQIQQITRSGGREIRITRKPDGVVCVHPPYNGPAANSMTALGALIVGNTLVVKAPRSCAAGTAWLWRDIVAPTLDDMGAPRGTVNLICTPPDLALAVWLESPDTDDLMFFGDSERGIDIGNQWTLRGKKAVLELSGNDGVLIWHDADIALAAKALGECFYGSAQVCIVPKYAIVHPAITQELIAALVDVIKDIRPGYPEDKGCLLSPVLKSDEFSDVLSDALQRGASLIHGGHRMEITGEISEYGYFVQPTIISVNGLGLADDLRAVRRETFFPLLPLVVPSPASDEELLSRCIGFMNENHYGLRNSLWTNSDDVIEAFCERVYNGGLLKVNDSHIGFVEGLPSQGGSGLSGGPFGEGNFPILRTSRLQGISIATDVRPREAIFDFGAS